MSEITGRLIAAQSEDEALGLILDALMAQAEPDVAEAMRACAIPHWFNAEIIAWLRGERETPPIHSQQILDWLTELTFVGPYHDRGYAYHKSARTLLLARWQEEPERLKELSGQLAEYYARDVEEATGEQRERMFHLLAADAEEGFGLFGDLFNEARDFYRLSTCQNLLELANEQTSFLSLEQRQWVRFREGQLAYISARWDKTLSVWEALAEETLPESLEGTLYNDLGLVYQAKGEWDRAIEFYERSLAIKEKVGDEHGMSTTLNNLGSVYQDKGEWDRAIEFYERSLAIVEKVGDVVGVSITLFNIASIYEDSERYAEAVELLERVVAIDRQVGHPDLESNLARLERVRQKLAGQSGESDD